LRRNYRKESCRHQRVRMCEGIIMQKERFNFVVDEKTRKEFHKIMEALGLNNKNKAFIILIKTYMRKHFESMLYRKITNDIKAYEVLWEQTENKDQ